MYKFYLINMAALTAGAVLHALIRNRSHWRRLVLFLLGSVVLNIVMTVLVLLEEADRHIYTFLCTLPFLLPHIFMELKNEIGNLQPRKRKLAVVGDFLNGVNILATENCEYKLLVRLRLYSDSGKMTEIRSKADVKLIFIDWVRRMLYDYVSKYPYTVKEMTGIKDRKICFYHYRYRIIKHAILPDKTFRENKLKNNSIIYGKQVDKLERGDDA